MKTLDDIYIDNIDPRPLSQVAPNNLGFVQGQMPLQVCKFHVIQLLLSKHEVIHAAENAGAIGFDFAASQFSEFPGIPSCLATAFPERCRAHSHHARQQGTKQHTCHSWNSLGVWVRNWIQKINKNRRTLRKAMPRRTNHHSTVHCGKDLAPRSWKNGGFSINRGTPIIGWFIMDNPV